jgi:hypothetical protein
MFCQVPETTLTKIQTFDFIKNKFHSIFSIFVKSFKNYIEWDECIFIKILIIIKRIKILLIIKNLIRRQNLRKYFISYKII